MEYYSNVVKAMIARSNARAADIADKIQARAYYQFQYVPSAGPLPGWSMEQQTEDAINEIGNIAYSSNEIAREAREIAQQAYNAAQAAIEMATNAITAAQNAQQTADTALNTANTAVSKADNAQASADAAQKAADAAQKSANDAQTAAQNAQSTANTAIENASQALSAANEAKASADQSNQRLDILEPIVDTLRWYENVTDNIDFNTRVELERAFLQGTANTNGPVAGPGWLDVDDDYNETYIRHKFIAQVDGACYVRFGTIVPDSSPIEVSSWTGWVKYALASELTSAVETINTSITSINGEITTIKSDITSIESDITELQGSLGSAEGDITAVTNALAAHKADYDNPHKVTAAQLGLATVYKYKGSVETYADLPTSGQQVGDVYNVKQADPDHNIEAGDNVAWDGTTWDILAGDTDLSGYAQLNSANTFKAMNAFRANIAVSNGTASGTGGSISFGISPTGETVQARIDTDTLGGLFYNTSTNQPHVFRIGNNINSFVIRDNGTMMTFSNNNNIFANVIDDASGVANWLGNANTATKLATARTINGVPFDGTQNITIEAGQGTFLPLTGGTVTGPIYLPSDTPTTDTQAVTKKYVDDSVASADAAQKAADAAQKSANDAQTAAQNAQSTANTAIENASQALSAANEAKASADQSNQRLDILEPIVDTLRWYENVTDNIDFNTRVELERAFLQGTANTNGPVAGPGWLDVDDDYNETYIRHKFIAQVDGACYVRFGTIVPDSSPIEVSSWTGWVKYALASELTSAVETINTSITSINGEITTIKSDITSIESDITELQGSLGSAEGDITAVTNALAAHKADYDNPHKVTAAQLGLATVYKYKGSVETYADLPTSGQQVGDVYNVKQADPDHNIEAGDNVAWDGTTWDILAGDTDLSGYAQLNSANTFKAMNAFRANIAVSNGTASGTGGSISFGISPTGETVQARIDTDTLGGLFYNTSTNQPHVFRIGNNINSFVIRDNGTMMTFSNNNNIFANVIDDASGVANWLGNANTATKLATARTINGVPFDGTQNITIEAGQGTFLPLTGGTVTGPIYLPSDTPTTDTQAVTKKYVDDSVAGAGGGDVTAAGDNAFTGLNTFANETTFGNELNVWDSLTSQSSTGQINIGRVSGANGAYITGESGGGLALHTKKGQPLELLDGVDGNLAVLTTSQATIYPNIVQIGSDTLLESVGIRKATIGDYPLQILDGNMIAAQFNGNSHKAAFEASEVMINSSEISTNFAIKNASQNILDCNGTAMHLRTGNSSIGLELGSGTSGWALQCPADATDVRVARRLYVGSQGGVGNGVISADNIENCLYFCGTAENTYYSIPNTGNTISYQAAANVYLINTSINNAASLTMNFSNMSFHATVGSTPYMCKTLTFWFITGATAPTVTWQFPSGAAVYYPKGVAPSLTANASNIINVVAIVDDKDIFSIQVCDVVALPYSG